KKLDAGSWFNEEFPDLAEPVFSQIRVPTLPEIIETFGTDANYYIETKTPEEYPEMAERLIALLQEKQLLGGDLPEGKVIIQSFSEESLREVKQIDPSIPLIQLISYNRMASISKNELERIKEYAVGIGANYEKLSKR